MERVTYYNGMWYITRRVRLGRRSWVMVGLRQPGTTGPGGFTYREYPRTVTA